MKYKQDDLEKVMEKEPEARDVFGKANVTKAMAAFLFDSISYAESPELQSVFLEAEQTYAITGDSIISDGDKKHLVTQAGVMDAVLQNRANPKLTMFRGDLIDPRAGEKGGVSDAEVLKHLGKTIDLHWNESCLGGRVSNFFPSNFKLTARQEARMLRDNLLVAMNHRIDQEV
ncbi:MAG: hypothetical protein FWE16_06070 [Firmicutes bacterium]|nr:hypothetical protein [Bacillota bacterium]